MKKKIHWKSILIGGFFSLFVPLGAFLYLKFKGYDGHIKLPPTYGIAKIDTVQRDGKPVYDTTFHTVRNLRLVNQVGDTISINDDLKGKILVVNFFFTSCATICPVLTKNMKLLNKAFIKNDTSVRFISITVDPATDSVARLREYADRQQANHDKWMFLTGDKKDIYDFARRDLFLDLPEGKGDEDDFIHPDKFVLIDKYRNIRGYYDGLDSNNVRLCAEDIAYLIVEKNRIHEKKKR